MGLGTIILTAIIGRIVEKKTIEDQLEGWLLGVFMVGIVIFLVGIFWDVGQ